MATLTTTLTTTFTPAVGDFTAQVTGGTASLQRRNTSGAAWAQVESLTNRAVIVSNPIAATDFRFVQVGSDTAIVQADQ